jgi:hypothetical protein
MGLDGWLGRMWGPKNKLPLMINVMLKYKNLQNIFLGEREALFLLSHDYDLFSK